MSVILTHHQAALMDGISAAIRRHTGKTISRSALMRAIFDAVLPCYPDWFECRSEDEIKRCIQLRLGISGNGPRPGTRNAVR